MDFSGILLAGGKSRRFSPNKIKIMSEGVPLIALQMVKLGFFAGEVIICTSAENKCYIDHIIDRLPGHARKLGTPAGYDVPRVRAVVDDNIAASRTGDIGPIAGIYTGLENSSNDFALVAASDMPLISYRLLDLLTREAQLHKKTDAVIIRNIKGIEALCGIYSRKCIKIIKEEISRGVYKISDILASLQVSWIGPERLREEDIDIYNFFNINSQKDIKEFVNIQTRGLGKDGSHNIYSRAGQKWKDHFFRGTGKGTDQEKI